MEQQKDNERKQPVETGQSQSTPLMSKQGPPGVSQAKQVHHIQAQNQPTQGFGYVTRKAEKLTTALYLVTDIMSEKEPMKWKARESAVDLLSDITLASSLSVSEKMTMLRNVLKKTEKIIAFLDIAQSAHLMSEMNASVLRREYVALKDSIESEWTRVYEKSKSIFSESFFDVPHESVQNPSSVDTVFATHGPEVVLDTRVKLSGAPPQLFHRPAEHYEALSTPQRPPSPIPATSHFSNQVISTQVSSGKSPLPMVVEKKQMPMVNLPNSAGSITNQASRSTERLPTMPDGKADAQKLMESMITPAMNDREFFGRRNDVERDDRRKIILALIKQKPALTVKDIVRSIPHVSEKTIQRELFAMVSEGMLIKRGERRWSTYSLRQP